MRPHFYYLIIFEGSLGISHHTDAGAVTVLLQDGQPGLQVLRRNGGKKETWHDVEARRGDLIINIGDVVQVWSNDLYQVSSLALQSYLDSSNLHFTSFLFLGPPASSPGKPRLRSLQRPLLLQPVLRQLLLPSAFHDPRFQGASLQADPLGDLQGREGCRGLRRRRRRSPNRALSFIVLPL